jgi:hypothetical protein
MFGILFRVLMNTVSRPFRLTELPIFYLQSPMVQEVAQYGHLGADHACASVIDLASESIVQLSSLRAVAETDAAIGWLGATRERIERLATTHHVLPREFATTLLFAALGPEESFFMQIGDGAIVRANETAFGVVIWPMEGEYANTTCFITEADWLERAAVQVTGADTANSNVY